MAGKTATELNGADAVTGASVVTGPEGPATSRPMRADAVKNRARILEAAEEIFATQGVSVPIDTVAERAGLGVGTLYRHFPTKEALFEAIVVARLEQLVDLVRTECASDDPGQALFSFLRQFAAQAAAKKDLFEALSSAGIDIKSRCSEMVDEMKRTIDLLRERAVEAGALRADVSTDEMVGLVMGACQAGEHAGTDDVGCQRMVAIVCDGLRVPTPGAGAVER
ncbi:MAG: TetR/AcrR family transcriptional regulator [Acidimicrobiales bacterium]